MTVRVRGTGFRVRVQGSGSGSGFRVRSCETHAAQRCQAADRDMVGHPLLPPKIHSSPQSRIRGCLAPCLRDQSGTGAQVPLREGPQASEHQVLILPIRVRVRVRSACCSLGFSFSVRVGGILTSPIRGSNSVTVDGFCLSGGTARPTQRSTKRG